MLTAKFQLLIFICILIILAGYAYLFVKQAQYNLLFQEEVTAKVQTVSLVVTPTPSMIIATVSAAKKYAPTLPAKK